MSALLRSALVCLLLVMGPSGGMRADSNNGAGAVNGSLYVVAGSSVAIYLDGVKLELSKKGDGPKAIPVSLHPGDRIVAGLSSIHSAPCFLLLFVSGDKQSMISFRAAAFKILPDPMATDFTEEQFNGPLHHALPCSHSSKREALLPYKNFCQGLWGDREVCAVGTIITSDLFAPMIGQ